MNRDRLLELKVGIFVFIGLAMVAGFVLKFGRLNEGFKNYYTLTVRFKDAGGLLKGSDVLFSGAKIGRVAQPPSLLSDHTGVAVPLRIYDYVKLPVGSKITVGSSGLLGDRFVSVAMPPGEAKEFIGKDAIVDGARESGMDDLTRDGGALVQELRGTVANVNNTVTRLNTEALSPEAMQNLRSSLQHLNDTTSSLAETSKKLDGVIEKAGATMTSAKQDVDDLQGAIADARKTFSGATKFVNEATTGRGALPALINDANLASDLRALVSNLRNHGILFYRNNAQAPAPSPPLRRR
ncbi:MAG: MlaD family protein [Verrucomicrobiota bacterium]